MARHGNTYTYDQVVYTFSHVKVPVGCYKHGIFWIAPGQHVLGIGCKKCADDSKRYTLETFIEKSNITHKCKYTYLKSVYVNNASYITITCPIHGDFEIISGNHLRGYGCHKCSAGISKPEIQWLDFMEVPEVFRHQTIKVYDKYFRIDAYDSTTNTIYEFHGDFWHGHPTKYNPNDINTMLKKTYGELYLRTMEKERRLKEAGYHLITIWETDWNILLKSLPPETIKKIEESAENDNDSGNLRDCT
jgi:G:T-mismatch repair DNA endonuclease (very short patch repair protein)